MTGGRRPGRVGRRQLPAGWWEGVGGAVVLLGAWQFLTSVVFPGRHVVPGPVGVVTTMIHNGFFWTNLSTTLSEAGRGWLIGNAAALVLAIVALFVPQVSRAFQQFGAITYCVPTVAVGPLILIFISPDAAKVAIAALSVFFVSLIAWVTGLRATDQTALDVVHVYGGTKLTELFRVRLRAALPSAGGGLALSAPAAVLGAIIGEYLGGVSGLGVAMVSAEESFQVNRTWAIGLVATVVSGIAYGAILLVVHRLGGAPQVGTAGPSGPPSTPRGAHSPLWTAARRVTSPVVAIVAIVVAWALALDLFRLSPYFAKSPAAVWSYLFTAPSAAAHRSVLFAALDTTLRDALLGWLVGTVIALVGAALLVQLPRARAGIFPIVMTLRSVPLIAMTPLIALVFGQGVLGVTVIAAIVTFVPSIVLVTSGLQAAPPQAIELARAYNLSSTGTLLQVRARYAVPSIFAAAKIAIPGSILGAVLAEWLITGNGVGHLMAAALIGSNFGTLWASAVAVSAISLLLYEVIGSFESAAGRRLAT